jgi:hypothetical protein
VFSTVVGRKRWYPLAMIAAWIGTRTLFYAWWNPWEPFLFACLSLPALWLLALEFVTPTSRTSPAAMRLHVGLISLLAVIVWWHNYRTMIAPLKWATP